MSFLIVQELPDEIPETTASTSTSSATYYINDIVCRCTSQDSRVDELEFGVVVYPETSLLGKLEELLAQGFTDEFTVFWLGSQSQRLETAGDRNVFLVERPLTVGMQVKRASMTSGNVIQVERRATVRVLGTDRVFSNVPVSKLKSLDHLRASVGCYILKHEWVGVVTSIEKCATVRMKEDGTQGMLKWTENMETELFRGSSASQGATRIRYPGQELSLTNTEILRGVEWGDNAGAFGGKWRLFRPECHSVATVISIEFTLELKWLQNLPYGFHDRSPIPAEKIRASDSDYVIINSLGRDDAQFGACYTLDYWGETEWEYQPYEEWLQRFGKEHMTRSHPSEQGDTAPTDEPGTVSHMGDGLDLGGNNESSDSLKIWSSLKMVSIENEFYGRTLTVELLCTQSWVTVCWPSYMRHLECLSSLQFEPCMSGSCPTLKPGTVVKFTDRVGSQPCFINYYGVVTFSDSRFGLMTANWYKYLPGTKPSFVGSTKSRYDEIFPHPGLEQVREGSIVTWEESSDFGPSVALGIVRRMRDDGMVVVIRSSRQEYLCWPETLKKLSSSSFYNALEGEWVIVTEDIPPHIPEPGSSTPFPSSRYIPSFDVLRSNFKNSSSFSEQRVVESVPKLLKFSDTPVTEVKVSFIDDVCSDLKRFSGGDPGIWIKTFEERKDLISVAMEGPPNTIYEDTLVLFILKIPEFFPSSPPIFHFYSFSEEEINPCFKTDGQVLFPLLNTYKGFPGFHTESWDPAESSVGLVLTCIRKLILCPNPFQNHPNFELLKLFSHNYTSRTRLEKNLDYLQAVIESIANQMGSPLDLWREEIYQYYLFHIPRFNSRIMKVLEGDLSSGPPLPSLSTSRLQSIIRQLHHIRQLYQQTYLP